MDESPTLADEIRSICRRFQSTNRLYLGDIADTRRLRNARKALRIPEDEPIILLYDDTLLGSNKVGFAICEGGLFWKNDWSVDTRRSYLSWGEFGKRKHIKEKNLTIELMRGDRIGVAVLDEQDRAQVVTMLNEIRARCRKKSEKAAAGY